MNADESECTQIAVFPRFPANSSTFISPSRLPGNPHDWECRHFSLKTIKFRLKVTERDQVAVLTKQTPIPKTKKENKQRNANRKEKFKKNIHLKFLFQKKIEQKEMSKENQNPKSDPKTARSVTPKSFGESLAELNDAEWDRADPAYNPELINVKKKTNKVTVFTAPKTRRSGSVPSSSSVQKFPQKIAENQIEKNDYAAHLGNLVANVVREYLKTRKPEFVKFELRLVQSDGQKVDLIPPMSK